MARDYRCGVGYDLHRLEPDRKLILGGVEVPYEKGLAGHSDADILMHALTDALLGAAALGDIGEIFPPSDPQWKDVASEVFLGHAVELLRSYGYEIVNVDAVIILERPKLLPFREAIRTNLARILGIERGRIGLKAKTSEKVGPAGRGEAAEAHAVALIARDAAPKVM
ncbi:MAG: 2-C-methyl-D-erythritol 2,4-cyclodiphosphate synthase [Acidobacteria bacterium]|nr:2-C-methyl-D-erythritol 2,4-cyclodiphosphate synthase [Acidobacteriota bacterium]